MGDYYLGDLLLFAGILISLAAQLYVTSSYKKYKKISCRKGLSGFEVAKMILDKHGLSNVYVTEVGGTLSDHYDPSRKVVRLSSEIFHGDSIASASVAAHEVGHAIQDKEGYSFMRFRATLFPLVKISSYGGYFAILIGVIFGLLDLIWIGIAMEIIILLFQIVTLPVEFDASNRAKKELKECNILTDTELGQSSSMLTAAALTYVASVLTTMLQILRLIIMTGGRRRN